MSQQIRDIANDRTSEWKVDSQYNRDSLVKGLDNAISVYRSLRRKLGSEQLQLQERAEKKSMSYFRELKGKIN